MKRYTTLLLVFMTTTLFAQDPYLQQPDPELDKQAKELTIEYDQKLGLTADQALRFEIKVEEFLIRAKKIRNELTGKEKLDALALLQVREMQEMGDILTQPQLDLYKKIRPTLQPLDVVEKDKEKKNKY